MESKTDASPTSDTTSTTWSFAPWVGAKTRQLANRAVSFARNKVRLLGSAYGHRLQETAQGVAHSTEELTTRVVHSVQETAQKAGHRIDETKSKGEHRRQELVDKIDDKLDGR
jgi:hypothetical protein